MSISNEEERGGEDRISGLPESIICDILNRLTPEEAIRTCVLSRVWEDKWRCIYSINIHDRSQKYEGRDFLYLVRSVLLLSRNIKHFSLSCGGEHNLGMSLTKMITVLLLRNIESLKLRCGENGIVLPSNLRRDNSSLRKLDVEMPCTFNVCSLVQFPNLTCLRLSGVEIRKFGSNLDTLTFTFPVLETFELIKCKWMNVKFVEIFAPSLTSFVSETAAEEDIDVETLDFSIKLFGPKLVKFESSGGSAGNFILAESPVVKAVLHHDNLNCELLEKYGLQFRRLLNEFSSLEELQLTYWVTQAIADTKRGLALPRYNKLRKLFVEFGVNIEGLLELLHSAPSLTTLILCVSRDDSGYDYEAVESVPSCIVSHLEEVELKYYFPDIDLATFLLTNGVKLKKFHVYVDEHARKDETVEKISAIPKASTCVSVLVE